MLTASVRTTTAYPAQPELAFSNYAELADSLASRNNITVTPANESGSESGTGIFQGRILRQRLSFTPYIFNQCSAACAFCSERLFRKQSMPLHMRLCERYAEKLARILDDLRGTTIFISLSGMEPLESLPLVGTALETFARHTRNGGAISDTVLYSNLSKAASDPDAVMSLLHAYAVTRIESSRHHFATRINDSIMRFKPGQPIRNTANYEKAVALLQEHVPVKLTCVLQKKGIATIGNVVSYIDWALSLGVTTISFRELAILGNQVTGGTSFPYIMANRRDIYSLITDLPSSFTLQSIVRGYYYFSFRYRYRNAVNVTFGVSDYEEMARHHENSAINKLIYYPDGSLCTDWNMLGRIC